MKTLMDTKTWAALAAIALMGLAGCGGGSSGGGGGGSTATGLFLDSAVEGLSYVSGDSSGFTNAEGEFVYEVGKAVRFTIGDIVIGEALGQRLMTPVKLVNGGNTNNTTVLNIARFLQSIDEDDNVSNGIVITEQVRDLARGKSINFAQSLDAFSDDGSVQIIVSELTAATTGGARALVSSSMAQAHLNSTIWGYYAGEYSGSFSGGDSGTWNVTLLADGSVSGSGFSNNLRSSFAVNGRVGTDGTLDFATGGTSTGASFSGTLTDDFTLSGTYSGNGGVTGNFTGRPTSDGAGQDTTNPDPSDVPIGSVTFSGSVSGTVSPIAQQVDGFNDLLIVAWGSTDGVLGVTVPRNGGAGGDAQLISGGSIFECATNLFGQTLGDCTGISHNADSRTISFDDVTVVGPAVGDTVRINGTLIY